MFHEVQNITSFCDSFFLPPGRSQHVAAFGRWSSLSPSGICLRLWSAVSPFWNWFFFFSMVVPCSSPRRTQWAFVLPGERAALDQVLFIMVHAKCFISLAGWDMYTVMQERKLPLLITFDLLRKLLFCDSCVPGMLKLSPERRGTFH